MDMASDTGLTVVVPQLVHQIAVTGLMDTTPIDNDSGSEHDEDTDGPPMKQRKMDVDFDFNSGASLKQIMFTINKAITIRLDSIESSLSALRNTQKGIEDKLDMLLGTVKQPNGANLSPNQNKKGAVIVGLPQQNGGDTGAADGSGILQDADIKPSFDGIQNLGPNVTLITLNCEEDHPNGTWLGDETNPEMRVRVIVSPSDLLHIHSNCRTPEKMALTLLDYLFDRETQAMSNLSGMGKHGKRQLDPLMIYGIRCHLITKFGISENEWHRIKQNIDSKCRTAFRRKQRGMPMQVKAFRGKSNSFISATNATEMIAGEIDQSDEDSLSHEDSLHIHHGGEMYLQGDLDIQQAVAMQGDGTGLPAEVQILHATPEQICQLQQAQHIQILQGDHVIQVPVPQHIQQLTSSELHESIQVAVSMPQVTDSMSLQTIAVDASDLAAVQPQ